MDPHRPESSREERRRHRRFALAAPRAAFCGLVLEDGTVAVVRVVDLSLAGVLVQVPPAFADAWPSLEQPVPTLTLNLDGDRVHRARGTVAWLGGHVAGGTHSLRSGLEFHDLDDATRAGITGWLAQVED